MIKEKIEKYKVKEISKITGIPPANIYRYARGEGMVTYIRFLKMLKYLNISIDEMIEEYEKIKNKDTL